ncbi:MAG: hypothetical protein ABIJ31_04505, partial [Pseudomonadota bacterium]
LNSTERLLNTIRSNKTFQSVNPSDSSRKEETITTKKINPKTMVAGVVIDEDVISLSLTGENRVTRTKELIKWQYVPLPEGFTIENERLSPFLKTTIERFLGQYKKVKIWTSLETKDLKLRHIVVPDLPDSKIGNAALWGLKKEFEIHPDLDVFDFQVVDTFMDVGTSKKKVNAFTGDRKRIHLLKKVFSNAGFPLTGITALPFAFQNFFKTRVVDPIGEPFVIVNISGLYSDIFCFSKAGVLLVRNVRGGANSLVEEFIQPNETGMIEKNAVRDWLCADFNTDSLEFEKIRHASDRLIAKIVRTGDYCSNNVAANKPIEHYLFYGQTDNCNSFMTFARQQIPGSVGLFNPLEKLSFNNMHITIPVLAQERNTIIPATAVSLSANDITPNFLYTYLDKEAQARFAALNYGIATTCLIVLILCSTLWFWLNSQENRLLKQQTAITAQLNQYTPAVTQEHLIKRMGEARNKANLLKTYTRDYLGLALINEVISLTPPHIFIDSLHINRVDDQIIKPIKKNNTDKQQISQIVLKGFVKTDSAALESTLTGLIIRLQDSLLFKNIVLEDKINDTDKAKDMLTFTALMEIE